MADIQIEYDDSAGTPVEVSKAEAWTGPTAGPRRRRLRRRLVLIDGLSALGGWTVGLGWHHSLRLADVAAIASLAALTLAAGRLFRIHLARTCLMRSAELSGLLHTVALVATIAAALRHPFGEDLQALLIASLATFAFLAFGRSWYRAWIGRNRKRGEDLRSVLVVGTNEEAAELARLCEEHGELGYEVVGALSTGGANELLEVPVVGHVDGADALIRAGVANGVLVATSTVPTGHLNELVRRVQNAGGHVVLSSGLQSVGHSRLIAHPLGRQPLFYLETRRNHPTQAAAKRALDLAGASLVLLATAPVWLVAAIAVKLQDGGSALFRQERIGQDGQPFTIYKFRTMVPDADRQLDELWIQNQRTGPLFKLAADPRVTKVGRILRATSIDELPQLLNVLQGSMSLVGPRPALATEVAEFDDELRRRLEVKPGVTGLWQVDGRDNPAFGAYRRFDLFYIENWSLRLDISILLQTVGVVLGRIVRAFSRRSADAGTVLD